MNNTAIETTLAATELRKLEVGDLCPYTRLREVIGKDPQQEGYAFVASARRKIERELECVLEAIPNVGIKRLASREVLNRGGKDLRHIRVTTRRAMKRQTTLVPVERSNGLSNEEKLAFHTNLSMLGILHHVGKPSSRKKISAAVDTACKTLPVTETLRLFGGTEHPPEPQNGDDSAIRVAETDGNGD